MPAVVFGGGGRNSVASVQNVPVFLRVQFKDASDPPQPVDVIDPVGVLLHGGQPQELAALGSVPQEGLRYPLIAAGPPGLYKLSFLTTGLKAGHYNVRFEGSWVDPFSVTQTLRVEGEIALGEISRTDSLIARVYTALMDDVDPRLYRLDEPVAQWSSDQLYLHMLAAVDGINAFPPRLTHFDFDTVPFDQFVVDGARVYGLYARARFEKANELAYSDVHTLDIKRADFYKSLADTLYAQWKEAIVAFKKMTPPTPIGLKGQQLPFRISRVLGLLPNFKTLFSG
jgi:hypothetical protein